MFQGYIEWSVASSALDSISKLTAAQSMHASSYTTTSRDTVVCTGLFFYLVDMIQRDTQRKEDVTLTMQKSWNRVSTGVAKISSTLHTLQAVSLIMFTNSLVTYAMTLAASSQQDSDSSSVPVQNYARIWCEAAALVAGMVVAKTVVVIADSYVDGRKSVL